MGHVASHFGLSGPGARIARNDAHSGTVPHMAVTMEGACSQANAVVASSPTSANPITHGHMGVFSLVIITANAQPTSAIPNPELGVPNVTMTINPTEKAPRLSAIIMYLIHLLQPGSGYTDK